MNELLKNKEIADDRVNHISYFLASFEEDNLKKIFTYDEKAKNIDKEQSEAIDKIPEKIRENLAKHLLAKEEPDEEFLAMLAYCTKENTAKKIIERLKDTEYSEYALSAFLSNKNISEPVRDVYFDVCGCDPDKLNFHTITNHISIEISKQIIEVLFDDVETDDDTGFACEQMFCKLLRFEKMPESVQNDIAYRLVSNPLKYSMESVFIRMTNSEKALEILKDIKSENRHLVFQNKHCPEKILREETASFIKETKKELEKIKILNSDDLYVLNETLHTITDRTGIDKNLAKDIFDILSHSPNGSIISYMDNFTDKALSLFINKEIITDKRTIPIKEKERVLAHIKIEQRKNKNINSKYILDFYKLLYKNNNIKFNNISKSEINKLRYELGKEFSSYLSVIEKAISASGSKEAKERFDKLYSTYSSITDREYDNFKTQADFFKLSKKLKGTPSIDSIRLYLPIKENELFKAYEETKQNNIIKNNEEISL